MSKLAGVLSLISTILSSNFEDLTVQNHDSFQNSDKTLNSHLLRRRGYFMSIKLVLTLAVLATLVGCGKSKKSSGGSVGVVSNQRNCSESTIDSYKEVIRMSELPINRKTPVNKIFQLCLTLEKELKNTSCPVKNKDNRVVKFAAYSDIASFCSEIETYVTDREPNPPHSPRPTPIQVPAPAVAVPGPSQAPSSNRLDLLVENLGVGYFVSFKNDSLLEDDLDLRSGLTRCKVLIPERSNDELRRVRGNLVGIEIRIYPGGASYDITAALTHTRDLFRLSCRSHNQKLSLRDLNKVLEGVLEIKRR